MFSLLWSSSYVLPFHPEYACNRCTSRCLHDVAIFGVGKSLWVKKFLVCSGAPGSTRDGWKIVITSYKMQRKFYTVCLHTFVAIFDKLEWKAIAVFKTKWLGSSVTWPGLNSQNEVFLLAASFCSPRKSCSWGSSRTEGVRWSRALYQQGKNLQEPNTTFPH